MTNSFDSLFGTTDIDAALRTALMPAMDQISGGGQAPNAPAKEEKPNLEEEAKKLAPAIGHYEWRGNDDPRTYGITNKIGAMGRYQFMPGTLKSDSIRYLGREVSPDEFLSDPKLQDELQYKKTYSTLAENYAKYGDLKQAEAATAIDHYGHNRWRDSDGIVRDHLDHRATHHGKDVGETPNDYAANVLSVMGASGPNIINSMPQKVAERQRDLTGFSAQMSEAQKVAPYGLVVLGADGSFLDYNGKKLSVQPPEQSAAAAPEQKEDFTSAYSRLMSGMPQPPEADTAPHQTMRDPDQEIYDPNSASSRTARERKAFDLVLAGQAPNMDVARKALSTSSAASLLPTDPDDIKKNQDALQNKALHAMSQVPGPAGFMSYLASKSEVAKVLGSLGADAANSFNILSSVAPKEYGAIKEALRPQSAIGQAVDEYGGGAIKTLAELAVLQHAMGPGMEGMSPEQSGGLLFGTQALAGGVAPVIAGQEKAEDVLKDATLSTVMGAAFPGATKVGKDYMSVVTRNAPGFERAGEAIGAGAAAATLGAATNEVESGVSGQPASAEDDAKSAINLGLFSALTEFAGGGRAQRERMVDRAASNVEEALKNLPEDLHVTNEPAPPKATTAPEDVKISSEGESHTKLQDLEDGKVLVESKDKSGAISISEMPQEEFSKLPDVAAPAQAKAEAPAPTPEEKVEPAKAPAPESSGKTEQLPEEKIDAPKEASPKVEVPAPHEARQPGKYETDAPLVEHEITRGENKGKIKKGIIATDLETLKQARAIDPYAFKKGDGFFISEEHVARPEGFEESQKSKVESQKEEAPASVVTAEPEAVAEATIENRPVETEPEKSASAEEGLTTAERTEIVNNLPVHNGSTAKEIRDYAIRNRIDVNDEAGNKLSWGNILDNIRKDAFEKAEAKKAKENPLPAPSPISTSGTLSSSIGVREAVEGVKEIGKQVSTLYTKDIDPAIRTAAGGISEIAHSIRAGVTPGSVGEGRFVSGSLREELGSGALSVARAEDAFASTSKMFDSMLEADQHKFIASMEAGESTGDVKLDAVKDSLRQLLDADRELIRSVAPNALEEFDKNYFPHIWKDPKKAGIAMSRLAEAAKDPMVQKYSEMMSEKFTSAEKRAFMNDIEAGKKFDNPVLQKIADGMTDYMKGHPDLSMKSIFGAHRPFAGKKGFLKERYYSTFAEGLAANLEPAEHNPAKLALLHHGEVMKFVAAHKVMREMRSIPGMLVFTRGEAPVPAGYERINDAIGKVMYKNAEGKLTHGGYWNMPQDGARVLNNYLSPGLWDKKWYKSLRSLGNAMNQFQLALSAFHAHFASLDAIVSQGALALKMMRHGDWAKGAGTLLSAPAAPFTDFGIAKKLKDELLHPGTHPELKALAAAFEMSGLRLNMDPAYRTNMRDRLKETWKEPNSMLRSLFKVPGAAVEMAMSPILEKLVPNLKIGAFAQIMEYELGRLGPDATHNDIRLVAQKAGESVENRLGQIAYDNLHWNRTGKDLAMIGVRSVGWNFGTIRELGGASMDWGRFGKQIGKKILGEDAKFDFTDRMAYSIALPVITGIYGSILQGIMTGVSTGNVEMPSTESLGAFLKDAYFPRTGAVDENGRAKRVSIPSYMKDVSHAGLAISESNWGELGNMGISKLHPFWGWLGESINNRDFYNTQITNTGDPLYKKGLDVLEHFAVSFEPFSVRGWMKEAKLDEPIGDRAMQFFGLPPAAAAISETPAEREMYRIEKARMGNTKETTAQHGRREAVGLIERQIRLGNHSRAEMMKTDAILSGTISRSDITKIDRNAKLDKKINDYKKLSDEEALRVMSLATEEEKPKFLQVLKEKASRVKPEKETPEDLDRLKSGFGQYHIRIGSAGKPKARAELKFSGGGF